jgi:hypothetical protein
MLAKKLAKSKISKFNLATIVVDRVEHAYSLNVLNFNIDGKGASLIGVYVNDFGISFEILYSSIWFNELKKRLK